MSEQKRLPKEKCVSESHECDKSKVEYIRKGLAYDNKSKANHYISKQQKDKDEKGPPEDPPKSNISSVHGLSSEILMPIVQAIVAPNDTTSSAEDIIRGLDTSEKIKSYLLEIISNGYYRKEEGIDREFPFTDGELQAKSNVSRFITKNYGDIQSNIQAAFGNLVSNSSTCEFLDALLCGQRGGCQQDSSHRLIQAHLMVASDGDGDYDPEHTKITGNLIPLVRSVPSVIYRMKLETKNEISTKVPSKDDKFVDILKTVKPVIDKYSWREKNEESNVSIYSSEEEEGSEGLASAYPHYCGWGDIDNIIDQSAMHGLDDHVQQFSDTQAAQVEDDQDEDENDSVTDDSSSEAQENNEGDVVLGNSDVSVEVWPIAEGIVAEESSYAENGSHELAGKDEIISIDLVLPQSEMAGKQSHSSLYIRADTTGIKHHLPIATHDGLEFAVTADNVIENLAVDTTLLYESSPLPQQQQSVPSSDAEYEQTPELPLIYGQTAVPTPTTLKYHSLYEFPQPEGQFSPFPSEVDSPTELSRWQSKVVGSLNPCSQMIAIS